MKKMSNLFKSVYQNFLLYIGKSIHIKEILMGSTIAFIYRFLGMFLGYIIILIISKTYGTVGAGLYNLSVSLITILGSIATLGMNISIIRYVGNFANHGDMSKIVRLYQNILKILLFSILFIAVNIYFFKNIIAESLFHSSDMIHIVITIAIVFPFMSLNNINLELLRGLKKINISEYLRSVNRPIFILLLLPILVVFFSNNASIAIFSFEVAVIVTSIISSYIVFKCMESITISCKKNLLKSEIIKTSLPMMITSIAVLIMGNLDTIMLSMYSSISNVGIYGISLKLAMITSFALSAVNAISAPKFSELFWNNRIQDLKEIVQFSAKLSFIVSAPAILILVIFPNFFLGLFGESFLDGKTALYFLVFAQFINSISGSIGYLMNMVGEQKVLRNIILIALMFNIVFNYFLIPIYGINGAAFATMISMIFWNLSSVLYIYRKYKILSIYIPLFKGKYYEKK